ncbi:MAG: penicillin-insensitive murein endopeptidase [Rhodomicrobium sp.]|nr:penicillin-insensitive murein endopeptidase [Rhodomicrobium sp.]
MAGKLRAWLFFVAGCGLLLSAACSSIRAEEAAAPDRREAKKVFGAVKYAAGEGAPHAIGQYDRGCIAGAQRIAITGSSWQAMRLSRNRFWGHPMLLGYIRKFARDVHRLDGWPGILVGDMAQPIGGPLLGGHASHQIGLDVDLWYMPMPGHTLSATEREQLSANNMVDRATLTVDKAVWSEAQVKLLRRAASYPEVARIFVHPAVKKALCEAAGADREWLHKIRPWFRHDDHFHIRLNCPPGSPACVAQAPVPPGDGCGAELDGWFARLRAVPKKPAKPPLPRKPMLVSDLPKECQSLLIAAGQAGKIKAANSN